MRLNTAVGLQSIETQGDCRCARQCSLPPPPPPQLVVKEVSSELVRSEHVVGKTRSCSGLGLALVVLCSVLSSLSSLCCLPSRWASFSSVLSFMFSLSSLFRFCFLILMFLNFCFLPVDQSQLNRQSSSISGHQKRGCF